jgi:hypothetical protein
MLSYLLPILLAAPLLPSAIAPVAVTLLLGVIAIACLKASTLLHYFQWKYVELSLLLPGALTALANNPNEIIRLAPLLFLVLYYPFESLRISPRLLWRSSLICLCYCITTQLALALGNPLVENFRDLYYPLEVNAWNYGSVESLMLSFGEFRAGGLWRNPNILAGNVFILYMASYGSWMSMKSNSHIISFKFLEEQKLLAFIVVFSIFLTATRTYIFSLVLFWAILVAQRLYRALPTGRLPLFLVIPVAAGCFLIYQAWERFVQGFQTQGSLEIKNKILVEYLNSVSVTDLLFGTGINLQFDAEFGYWLGFGGILALLAVILFYSTVMVKNVFSIAMILPILIAGLGNTQMFGLLTASLLIPTIISVHGIIPRHEQAGLL